MQCGREWIFSILQNVACNFILGRTLYIHFASSPCAIKSLAGSSNDFLETLKSVISDGMFVSLQPVLSL